MPGKLFDMGVSAVSYLEKIPKRSAGASSQIGSSQRSQGPMSQKETGINSPVSMNVERLLLIV